MTRAPFFRGLAICAVALLGLTCLPADAQWKWRDSSGHIQYSDLPPPPGTPDKDILARPAPGEPAKSAAVAASGASSPAAASSATAPNTSDPELEARRKQALADQAAKQKAEDDKVAAAKADNCSRARSQVKLLESGVRLVKINDAGEREVMDDAARDAEMKRSRDVIATDCI